MILAVTAILSLGAGCGDDGSPADGGTAEGGTRDGGAASGTVEVHFLLRAESSGAPEVNDALIQVMQVRARNDRGGEFEPVRDRVGVVDLVAGDEVDLAPAVPATYGRVTVRMAPDGSTPTLELSVPDEDRTLEIVVRDNVELDARCDAATVLDPGGVARIDLELDVSGFLEDVHDEMLPDAEDGVIHVDERTAPAAAAAAADALGTRWQAVCDSVDSSSAELRSTD